MAVDGKNASGRLAVATVLWLLVAIFANQNCVYCEGEEDQQRAQQLQVAQLQQQQLQQQQQQQDQQQRPALPPSPPPPSPQQQQQQQQQPLLGSMMGPLNRIENELQPGVKNMVETTMNPDFGGSSLQQQLRNGESQLNIPGNDGQGSFFSGGLPMATGSQQFPTMQTNGPSLVPNFAETNPPQGINPNTQSMQTNLLPPGQNARRPLQQINKPTIIPQPLSNNQQHLFNNPQNPLNNPQQSFNSAPNSGYNPHSLQMQQRPGLALPPHMPRFPLSHYIPGRLPMDQPMQKPYPAPYYPDSNVKYGYEVQGQTLSNAPVYPDQSASKLNIGDFMQQPAAMLNNIMPSNPMQFVQKPAGMLFTTVDKLGRYTEGVRQGLGTAIKGVVSTILDETESGAKKAFELGSNGTTSLINFGRRLFVPDPSRNLVNSGGEYSMQQSIQPQNYPYNPYTSTPNYGGTGYNNMQHYMGVGQYAGGNNNGQMPEHHTGSQMNAEYRPQEENMQNSGMPYPVNPPQPIIHYGQP